jgi:hypothetical protein
MFLSEKPGAYSATSPLMQAHHQSANYLYILA